jgi:rhamnosyltransferase
MKVAAVIVSFNPDSNLTRLVDVLHRQVQRVIVVDNASANSAVIAELDGFENVDVVRMQENTGIARALNIGLMQAESMGVDLVLTMDQDTLVPGDYVDRMLSFYRQQVRESPRVGMVSPVFLDANSGTYSGFVKLSRFWMSFKKHPYQECPVVTSFAVSSGSFLPMDVYKALGGFREDFFIDHVDSEYCLRMEKAGYCILANPDVIVRHAIGNREKRRLLGITIKPNHHNAVRRYYIARNGVLTAKAYFSHFPSFLFLLMLRNVHEILGILFYESDKLGKLKNFAIGIWHGLLDKTGVFGGAR